MNLAMERGEVGGRCSYSWEAIKSAIPDWMRDKKVEADRPVRAHPASANCRTCR